MNKKELTKEQIEEAKFDLRCAIKFAELDGYEMSEEEKMLNFAWYAGQISDEEYSRLYSKLVNGIEYIAHPKE